MKTAMLNIKIDPRVKRDASKVAENLGFSLSALVTASLKELVRQRAISFSLLEPSVLLKEAIRDTRALRARGKSFGPFTPMSAMMKSLRS
ncbi:hypothetical protein A2906_02065 [Candidatus Nomurabacteria bacterium RIFCSPLOWO2_01_FULL_37_25]|nr:MAG: hypothetical protein A2640_02620 [Candidatus Nomurabacteria bacterium RIFCSPHIGHO2_01_FULL_36_23]OGI87795.1 MAG: hypothetical protein A2906_02065 [Candidatus Nomurabacteria bacterium RIFCSPLOWO2_01_FULL_37_25]